jgi:hypothetical protein
MRVAVHQPGQRAAPAPVELGDLAANRPEVAHPADGGDSSVVAEQKGVLEHLDLAEGCAPEGSLDGCGRDELGEIANEQLRGARV